MGIEVNKSHMQDEIQIKDSLIAHNLEYKFSFPLIPLDLSYFNFQKCFMNDEIYLLRNRVIKGGHR